MTGAESPDRVNFLRQDLKAALAMRELAYARRVDEDLVGAGGKIYYAIDASILRKLFESKPRADRFGSTRIADGRTARAESYQIFGGPHSDARLTRGLKRAQARLREVLLWYLVDGRSAGDHMGVSNLLLLPGHTAETWRLYDNIVEDLDGQADRYDYLKETASRLREIVAQASGNRMRDRARQDALMRTISDIVYDLEEPHRRFARINELFQRGQLLGLGAAVSHPRFADRELRGGSRHPFLTPRADDAPAARVQPEPGSRSWWTKTLHGRLPVIFIDNDREALSTLDQINRLLDPAKARVILFTDNERIIESGASYLPFKDADVPYSDLSFSDLYLRHPKSLLVDARLMRPATEDPNAPSSSIDGWLDALLAASVEMESPQDVGDDRDQGALARWAKFRASKERLESRINEDTRLEKAVRVNPDLHANFVEKWTELISGLDADYVASSAIADDEVKLSLSIDTEAASVEQVDALLDACRVHVRRLAEQSWSAFFNTAADTGLELIDLPSIDNQRAVWTVPPLYIRADPKLRDIVETFWDPERLRRDPSEILRRLNDPALLDSRQSSYVRTLCYGLLFAFAGRWGLTKLLAERALHIAGRIRSDSGADDETRAAWGAAPVTGREAHYLLAVACRITAVTPADLDRARSAIGDADAAKADLADTADSTESGLSGLRFEAEELTIDIARNLLPTSEEEAALNAEYAPGLRERVLNVIRKSGLCDKAPVRLQSCISLRSEYFYLLLHPADARTQRLLPGLIREQQADMTKHYRRLDLVPLRDRALLRLAASAMGTLDRLPAVLQQSTLDALERPTESYPAHRRDRRRIVRIEKAIEQLNRLVLRLPLDLDEAAPRSE